MDKRQQLEKFGTVIKNRRQSLNLTIRELSEKSGISAALIAKLENASMYNFPKAITLKQLSDALMFEQELFALADILFEQPAKTTEEKSFEDQLRELLATKTTLSPKNIEQTIYFISGLEKLQEIDLLAQK